MKLNFPAAYSSITVDQFVKYKNSHDDVDKVIAITGADYEAVRQVTASELPKIIDLFEQLLGLEQQQFAPIIDIEIEPGKFKIFGLVPNFDRISYGEYEDIQTYCDDFFKYAAHLLSILYRPITERIGDNYLIEPYSGARSEFFRPTLTKHITLDVFNAGMLFFSTIAKELSENSQVLLWNETGQAVHQMTEVILETQN